MKCFMKLTRAYAIIAAISTAVISIFIAIMGALMFLASAVSYAVGGGDGLSIALYILFIVMLAAAVFTYEHRHEICKKD